MRKWTSEDFLGVFDGEGDWSGMCLVTHETPYMDLIEPARVKKKEKNYRRLIGERLGDS